MGKNLAMGDHAPRLGLKKGFYEEDRVGVEKIRPCRGDFGKIKFCGSMLYKQGQFCYN